MGSPVPQDARAALLSILTPEQQSRLVRLLLPETRALDSVWERLENWAHRCAANGLTADVAWHMGSDLVAELAKNPNVSDAIGSFIAAELPGLHGGAVTKGEAARLAARIYQLLEAERTLPDAPAEDEVIDTTARVVTDDAPAAEMALTAGA